VRPLSGCQFNHGGYIPRPLGRFPGFGFWMSDTPQHAAGIFISDQVPYLESSKVSIVVTGESGKQPFTALTKRERSFCRGSDQKINGIYLQFQ
jgi:hypothetical protein